MFSIKMSEIEINFSRLDLSIQFNANDFLPRFQTEYSRSCFSYLEIKFFPINSISCDVVIGSTLITSAP